MSLYFFTTTRALISPPAHLSMDFEIWLSSRSSYNLTTLHLIINMTGNILATVGSLLCLRLKLMENKFQCLQTDHDEHWGQAFQRVK